MLSERLLTRRLRALRAQQLRLEPLDGGTLPPPTRPDGYLLYVHVPFCERLCPYCSFNRYPLVEDTARRYFRNLREEMRRVADLGYRFTAVYVGGGTPTVLPDELVATIDLARELFDVREVSCETNPNHLVPEVLERLRGRVQRLSVGVQSFDDDLLRQMRRYDAYGSASDILARVEAALGVVDVLNLDMIFNVPSQTEAMLLRDVATLEGLGVDQVTWYPLMVSPSVERQLVRALGTVDYGSEAGHYRLLSRGLARTFVASSAWAFSRRGGVMIDEYIVEHDDYLGIGSGSFSLLDGVMYANTFSLRGYDAAVEGGRLSVDARFPLATREHMRYAFMMRLFGLSLDKRAFRHRFGVPVERALWQEMAFLRAARAFSRDDGTTLELSERGRYLLVVMMREFFIGVNGIRDLARRALPAEERELFAGEAYACPGQRLAPAGD